MEKKERVGIMKLLNKLILISDQKGFQDWHTTKKDSSVLTDWKLTEHHSLAQPNLNMIRTLTLANRWAKSSNVQPIL